jgi:serine phosphatase RsbU (regulator of sigma subunit)
MSNTARVAWICAATLAVFVVWVLTATTTNTGVAFFYAVPVGLATWWFGRRAGAIAIAACCSLYILGDLIQPVTNFGIAFGVRLLAFVAVAVLASFLRERLLALEHSAVDLEAIRAALTPAMLPNLPDIDAAAAFVPSEHGVSGDFYLLTNGPDGSTVAVVGDVVGHGPEAARLATFVRARFAAFAASTSDPAQLLMLANAALAERPGRERELVSATCLRFHAGDSRLSWAVAGHPLPLRLPGLVELDGGGETFLLGADPDLRLARAETALGRGEGVVVYTDGATDVRQGNRPLGRDGLVRLLAPLAELPARGMVERIEAAILGWAEGPVRDDLCVLVLRSREGDL